MSWMCTVCEEAINVSPTGVFGCGCSSTTMMGFSKAPTPEQPIFQVVSGGGGGTRITVLASTMREAIDAIIERYKEMG